MGLISRVLSRTYRYTAVLSGKSAKMGKKRSNIGKKNRENRRRQKELDLDPYLEKQPHSLIIQNPNTKVGKNTQALIANMRSVMEPFTASSVKVQRTNKLKDFVSIAATINVSHIMVFNKTDENLNLRIIKVPRGPTLWFNVKQYSLMKDVQSALNRPHADQHLSKESPLCVMQGFSDEKKHSKLIGTFIRNMFPTTNIPSLKLDQIRRVVIWSWNDETEEVEFRQYVISVTPEGCSKKVKKIIEAASAANRNLPNMGRLENVEQFIEEHQAGLTSGADSDGKSEAEESKVELAQEVKKRGGNVANEVSKIRLTELGPRMTLKLIKIQEGINDGEVLYHSFQSRTPDEVMKLKQEKMEKVKEKNLRKMKQADDVAKKASKKEAQRKRNIEVQAKREAEKKKATGDTDTKSEKSTEEKVTETDETKTVPDDKSTVGETEDAEVVPRKKKKFSVKVAQKSSS